MNKMTCTSISRRKETQSRRRASSEECRGINQTWQLWSPRFAAHFSNMDMKWCRLVALSICHW